MPPRGAELWIASEGRSIASGEEGVANQAVDLRRSWSEENDLEGGGRSSSSSYLFIACSSPLPPELCPPVLSSSHH